MEEKVQENHEKKDELFIEFAIEVMRDRKKDTTFLKVLYIVLAVLMAICIGCMVWLGIYCQDKIDNMADRSEKRMYEFLSDYDFSSEIDLDTGTISNSSTSGNINFNQSR